MKFESKMMYKVTVGMFPSEHEREVLGEKAEIKWTDCFFEDKADAIGFKEMIEIEAERDEDEEGAHHTNERTATLSIWKWEVLVEE